MLEFLMITENILLIIAIAIMLKLKTSIDNSNKEVDKPKEFKRIHSNIGQANFNNILQGRNNYDKYKNKDGLYEPVTGKRGIELKEKGE